MAQCFNCDKKYFNYDSDAGTHKEMFCSEQCAQMADYRIDIAEQSKLIAELEAEKRVWQDRAEELWQILDDIDTLYDVYKSNHDGLINAIDKHHKRRFEMAESYDGYNLTWIEATEKAKEVN